MEKLDRTLALAMLASLGLLSGRLAATIAGGYLTEPVALPPVIPLDVSVPAADTSPFLERNVFRSARERDARAPVDATTCVPSELKLIATLAGDDAAITVASDEVHVLRSGDHLDGREILRIEARRAYARYAERCELLTLDPTELAPARDEWTIVQRSPTEVELDRDELQAALADVSRITRDGRFVPRGTKGFALSSLRPGGVFERLGLRRGDVVQRIAGFEVMDSRGMMEAYTRLRDTTEVAVDLERDGRPTTITYRLNPR